ncbi:hypothetical protein PC116_g12256 [Phytophthora cactorum]|uniref:Uncharacterized protein n=1 Tax=Phytophthora cactorum TaxID=29920 RepID=A0A8T1D7E4_9STRA|nr:hypothetical protein PC114_g12030 [Phytophthora cactorum]KAG2937244.1 hypothetical protein PC117_g11778 [Phytophthora cactorum]KAG3031854.1 hypothetical protein PC119_g5817 [Phytophthora cactorum]KAG3193320.1 hypothetical protein C6341_g216 [Phytophthora cactorum]KAG4239759.1 hypothetical protein PC116_g12256 [Phytophthora cactorum]
MAVRSLHAITCKRSTDRGDVATAVRCAPPHYPCARKLTTGKRSALQCRNSASASSSLCVDLDAANEEPPAIRDSSRTRQLHRRLDDTFDRPSVFAASLCRLNNIRSRPYAPYPACSRRLQTSAANQRRLFRPPGAGEVVVSAVLRKLHSVVRNTVNAVLWVTCSSTVYNVPAGKQRP